MGVGGLTVGFMRGWDGPGCEAKGVGEVSGRLRANAEFRW
jgi:hypothetical protein